MEVYISPMAGVTDYAYRKIMEKFNPNLLFTEMVNAHFLVDGDKTTINELLKCDSFENTGTQVFGYRKEDIIDSFLILERMGFNRININMGCPQPKIIKNGSGCGLLLQKDLVEDILKTLKYKLSPLTKISIKIRIGYKNFDDPEYFLNLAEKYKLDFICVHGRTQEQVYTGKADWGKLKELSDIKRTIKFIGNGDIFSYSNMIEKCKGLNIDGIMLARGIVGNPWLIDQCRKYETNEKIKEIITLDEIKEILMEHLLILAENKGERVAAMEINKFIRGYFKNYMYDKEFSNLVKNIILEKNFKNKIKIIKGI